MRLLKFSFLVVTIVVGGFYSPATGQERLSPASLEKLLKGDVHPTRIIELIKRQGVNFEWTDEIRNKLKKAGAGDDVMQAIDGAVIRFRLAEKAKRDELEGPQQSADATRSPTTKSDSVAKEQEASKGTESAKTRESEGSLSVAPEQQPTFSAKTDISQQKVHELPPQLKETADQVLTLEKIAIRDGEVSGELANRSSQGVYGVELQVLYSWRWNNDFQPGRDDPGRAEYFKIDREISPGQRVPFVHKPSPPLPVRKDGTFEITIKVISFTKIFRSG
jgi:hypothetical protein